MKLREDNGHSETDSTKATDDATAGNGASVATTTAIDEQEKEERPAARKSRGKGEAASDSELDQNHTAAATQRSKSLGNQRKRDLINLQSALSPKYIGYANANSPTPISDTDDSIRTTRRRNNQAVAVALVLNNSSELKENELVSTPKLPFLERSKNYLSPIDKLLIKNGGSSPNSMVFEPELEEANRKQIKRKMKRGPKTKEPALESEATAKEEEGSSLNSMDIEPDLEDVASRKQLKRKMKSGPKSKATKELTSESEGPAKEEEAPGQEMETNQTAKEEEEGQEKEMDEPTAKEQGEGQEMETSQTEDDEAIARQEMEEDVPKQEQTEARDSPDERKNSVGSQAELQFALPVSTSTQSDMKSSPSRSPTILGPPANNSSMKSPSSISLDSAKGSSIVTDSSWHTYQVGDLYWGKVFSYCFWPCMVCPDPLGQVVGNLPTHPQRKSLDNAIVPIQVHVRFFADNGRRNWIKPENLIPFNGLKAFEELREEIRIKLGPKSGKYRQMVPKRTKVMVWQQAIDEAQIVGKLPYSERLEKFYQIYESAISLNKQKRKRTNSMLMDTSDVGSSLYDSTDNLHPKAAPPLRAIKRERSDSPFSPAFSPVKEPQETRSKRRKLSNGNETETGGTSESNQENPEFRQLFQAIKEYVMGYQQEDKVEKVLYSVVKNIWSLKQIQLRELEREKEPQIGRPAGAEPIKRLSNRLKTLMLRRSITPVVVTPSTTPAPELETERRLSEVPKPKKQMNRPIEEVVDDILQLDRKYLFRGLTREPVCKYCYVPGLELQRCSRNCNTWMHAECLKRKRVEAPLSAEQLSDKELTCHECITGISHNCCICHQVQPPASSPPNSPLKEQKESLVTLVTCTQPACGIKFHPTCCKYWPQASVSKLSSRCPMHVCHTCVSDDPSGKYQQLGNSKLSKCVKCPATYHQDSHCIPAGSRMLTSTHLICPRHNIAKADAHVNVLWCYICVQGGELVCCETCPIAVHAHCRNIPIKTNESYICEECESGRLPLYGEIVWAKFNNFRWWPSIILPPTEVPSNILKKPHGAHDFVVRFFGTHDHGWISRRRVYLYIEGDTCDTYRNKTQLSHNYAIGVEEASRFLKIIKAKRLEQDIGRISGNKLYPPPYVKIKANKPVPPVRFVYNLEDLSVCDCQPGLRHPCGPESGCLNRMLYNECNPEYCRAGDRCENQLFELRKSPRLEVVYMNERGFGLVCREAITEGDFVIEYVGEVVNHAEFQQRLLQKQRDRDENYYFLGVEKDFIIDAGPKGNLARFMNHSCEPNCETQKWTVNCTHRVGLFAIKDIPADTELTFNYLWDDLMNNGKKACFCGAERCSGQIGGKTKDQAAKETNAQTTSKGKTNAKPKPLQRSKGNPIRLNIAPKKTKKPAIKHISADDAPADQ